MTKNQLVKFAMLAFGRRWKAAMSEQLNISREQLWRYEHERTELTEEAQTKIKAGLRKHFQKQRDQIDAALKALN